MSDSISISETRLKFQKLWRSIVLRNPIDLPPYNPPTPDPEALSLASRIRTHIKERISPIRYSEISCMLDQYPGHLGQNIYTNGHYWASRFGKNLFVYQIYEKNKFLISSQSLSTESKIMWEKFFEDPTKPMSHFVFLAELKEQCPCCGMPVCLETDGHVVRIQDPCEYPGGYKAWTVEADFPSGVVMVKDSLDEFAPNTLTYKNQYGQPYDINSEPGKHRESEFYAMDNVFYGSCGNSCPGIYKVPGQDIYHIGNQAVDDDWVEIGDGLGNATEYLGSVSTDRWAFMFVDEQIAQQNNPIAYNKNKSYWDKCSRIQMTPGRYQMTYYRHRLRDRLDDNHLDQIFAIIRRIGPC